MSGQRFFYVHAAGSLEAMIGLTATERGIFWVLVSHCAEQGKAWELPADADCARLCGLRTKTWLRALSRFETLGLVSGRQIVATFIKAGPIGRSAIAAAIRQIVWEQSGGACTYCGVELTQGDPTDPTHFHCDHVRPVSKGGQDDLDNLVAACRACNLSKRDKTLEEWRGQCS